MRIRAGAAVDLSALTGQELTPELLVAATERIMVAITSLLEQIRGERAPAERFNPRTAGVAEIGNPNDPRNVHLPRKPKPDSDADA
ncbi:MAG: hypothetical protein H0V07_03725 [Propionibacteriales bacterium]|nr:hypothetical protein [Propionibacteriales bacterium]